MKLINNSGPHDALQWDGERGLLEIGVVTVVNRQAFAVQCMGARTEESRSVDL